MRTPGIKNDNGLYVKRLRWVNDSTPEGEFQETVKKAKAMLNALALAEELSTP